MKSTRALVVRVGIATTAMLLLLFGVIQVLKHPVTGETETYTALFTDANGLRAGNDVRLYGVRVGKISSISLDGTNAKVAFVLSRDRTIYTNTKLAIRYQNLTGQRYLDIQQPETAAAKADSRSVIGVAQTVPSFDITALFNGLQPVLSELKPEDLNAFSSNMLAVIEGDGTGLGPALDAIDTLSKYAVDRQSVVSTLVRNMARISERIGGRSGNAMIMVSRLTDVFVTLQQRVVGLVDFAVTIPPVLEPAISLLYTVGLSGTNSDLSRAIDTAFPDRAQAVDALSRLPGLLQSLTALIPTGAASDRNCSNGTAQLPQTLQVLVGGQRITLCNR